MKPKSVLWSFLLVLLCLTCASAQQVTVSISGRVTDITGAVVTTATVTAVNTDTGFTRRAKTDSRGGYLLPVMPVGAYQVTAEAAAFKRATKSIHLDIGASATVDFSLAVGQVTQEVEVQAVSEGDEPTRIMVSSV